MSEVNWEKFFTNEELSWEEKRAVYPQLLERDDRMADVPTDLRGAFFDENMYGVKQVQETGKIEGIGQGVQQLAEVVPFGIGHMAGRIGEGIEGNAASLADARNAAANISGVAQGFGVPGFVANAPITAGDTLADGARR